MKTFDINDTRNKLTPVINLIAMLENGLVAGNIEMHDLVLQEIEQVKDSVKYLTTEDNSKYNQSLIDKVYNREAVIEVDDFTIIKDLINFMYPDDPYLEDVFTPHRYVYYTCLDDGDKKYLGSFSEHLENEPRIKASEFLL